MSSIKFELNRQGVRSLLRSDEAKNMCEEIANDIVSRCGDGYEVTTHVGKKRVNASVHAATKEAKRDNIENKTILKAAGKI